MKIHPTKSFPGFLSFRGRLVLRPPPPLRVGTPPIHLPIHLTIHTWPWVSPSWIPGWPGKYLRFLDNFGCFFFGNGEWVGWGGRVVGGWVSKKWVGGLWPPLGMVQCTSSFPSLPPPPPLASGIYFAVNGFLRCKTWGLGQKRHTRVKSGPKS